MKVIIDAMGGDNAPLEIIKGAVLAKDKLGIDIVLVGDSVKIKKCAEQSALDLSDVQIVHTADVVTMESDAANVLREHKESSMVTALRILSEGGGDAAVSAGNTGALLVASTLVVKRIHGIKRAAITTVMPNKTGKSILVDGGANVDCTPDQLVQFAYMGYHYAKLVTGKDNPSVGLINNGTEKTKGTELQKQAYAMLEQAHERGEIYFCGNIEGRALALGGADVCLCDGFTGNIALKTFEGVALFFLGELKAMFKKNLLSKLAAAILMPSIRAFKAKVDYKEVGGAPLLGIAKPVIKAHGSSDAQAFFNAVRQAVEYASSGITEQITQSIAKMKDNSQDQAEKQD